MLHQGARPCYAESMTETNHQGETEMSNAVIDHSTETRSIEQQVKDAVYTWALVNAPNVIAEARKLVAA